MGRLGIGIVTYNRPTVLARNLARTLKLTVDVHAIVVADDGSTGDTQDLLAREFRGSGVAYCRGKNKGVAWNKNRALFYLNNVCKCDQVVLLEDDSYPTQVGWERAWVEGASRYGHINLAAPWFPTPFHSGDGTIERPFRSVDVTAQCTAFSAEALDMVGFMDTRFARNGYAHPEHSYRMVRAGYGGVILESGAIEYYMIDSPIGVSYEKTFAGDPVMLAVNRAIYFKIRDESIHRWAWRSDAEFAQFRAEMLGVEKL